MIVGVVGTRTFTDYNLMCHILSNYNITKIVSGGARGADRLAKKYAIENNIPIKEYFAEWDKYGSSAGVLRNTDIINDSEMIIAFWNMKSTGTLDSIEKAKKQKKPIVIIDYVKRRMKKINFSKN